MGYYSDIYSKRLNRFGETYQARKQGQREKEFEDYLAKSVYRIDFEYDDEDQPGTLEPYKEDETETLAYLLTRVDLNIPSGTVLELPDKDDVLQKWMVMWLETMRASGYNRYIILRLAVEIADGIWGYIKGPKRTPFEDTLKSHMGQTVYGENEELYLLITPFNESIQQEQYFEVTVGSIVQGFRVTAFDILSTPGVEYVSLDPTFIRDDTPAPEQVVTPDDQFYWLNQGTPVKPTTPTNDNNGTQTAPEGQIVDGGITDGSTQSGGNG